jgi:hypothetical protein
MLRVLVALALLSAPVGAADFRVLDFGDACASIQAREEPLGSVAIPWQKISGADIYAFKGREFNRELLITYFCPKGTLFSGNYYFPVEPLDVAVTSYRAAYDLLVSMYGAPFFDTSPWQVGANDKDPRAIASDPQKYTTAWKTPRLHVALSLMPNFPSEGPGRRVFIVVTRLKK